MLDVRGREIAQLWDGPASTTVGLVWNSSQVRAGTYLVRVTGENVELSRSVVIAR